MTEQEQPNTSGQEYQPTPPPVPQQEQQYGGGQHFNQEPPRYQQTQSPYGQPQNNYPPQSYMAMNIAAAVVGLLACGNCCISMILGIVGIVFSSQVNSKFLMGDVMGAQSSSSTAKILGLISLILSGLTIIGSIIYYAVAISAMGGMDAYMEMIKEAVEQSQNQGY